MRVDFTKILSDEMLLNALPCFESSSCGYMYVLIIWSAFVIALMGEKNVLHRDAIPGFIYCASFSLLSSRASSIISVKPRCLSAFYPTCQHAARTVIGGLTVKHALYCRNKGSHSSSFEVPRRNSGTTY